MSFEKVIIGNAELYCGDCMEVMPTLPKVDAVITDPPYGIPITTRYGMGPRGANGIQVDGKNFAPVIGNDKEFDPTPFVDYPFVLLWGANHFAHKLPHNGRWLIWDKRCGVIPQRTQADCEVAWVNKYGAARVFRHIWDGMVKDSEHGQSREHPTQKPVALMRWCLQFAEKSNVILDPFMGSGTTGVAVVEEQKKFIGIEFSREYFDIACRRIEQAQQQLKLF